MPKKRQKKQMTPEEQADFLGKLAEVHMDNLSMAIQLVDRREEIHNFHPAVNVQFHDPQGRFHPFQIQGKNCGFLITPVFNSAMIDCRRRLAFFGLKLADEKLIEDTEAWPDHRLIEDFNRQTVKPDEFLRMANAISPSYF